MSRKNDRAGEATTASIGSEGARLQALVTEMYTNNPQMNERARQLAAKVEEAEVPLELFIAAEADEVGELVGAYPDFIRNLDSRLNPRS